MLLVGVRVSEVRALAEFPPRLLAMMGDLPAPYRLIGREAGVWQRMIVPKGTRSSMVVGTSVHLPTF